MAEELLLLVPLAEHCPCSQGGQGAAGFLGSPSQCCCRLFFEGRLQNFTIPSIYGDSLFDVFVLPPFRVMHRGSVPDRMHSLRWDAEWAFRHWHSPGGRDKDGSCHFSHRELQYLPHTANFTVFVSLFSKTCIILYSKSFSHFCFALVKEQHCGIFLVISLFCLAGFYLFSSCPQIPPQAAGCAWPAGSAARDWTQDDVWNGDLALDQSRKQLRPQTFLRLAGKKP